MVLRHLGCDGLLLAYLVLVHAKQTHGKTGGAKAALRGVVVAQRSLNRVGRAISLCEVLCRPNCHAMHRVRHANAAVDGFVANTVFTGLANHHGAGTAVAFATAFFGVASVQVFAQHL